MRWVIWSFAACLAGSCGGGEASKQADSALAETTSVDTAPDEAVMDDVADMAEETADTGIEIADADPCQGRACGDFGGASCGACDGWRVCSDDGQCLGWRAIDGHNADICGVLENGMLACLENRGRTLPAGTGFSDLAMGSRFACALSIGGEIHCAGDDPATFRNTDTTFGPSGSNWVQVVAGSQHYCGRDADGKVQCWGIEAWNEVSGAPGNGILVSASDERTCVIDSTHSVQCVGRPDFGDLAVPGSEMDFVVAAEFRHACGILRATKRAVCWGDSAETPVEDTYQALALAPYSDNTCGLTEAGNIRCWGFLDNRKIDGAFSDIAMARDVVCGIDPNGGIVCRREGGP